MLAVVSMSPPQAFSPLPSGEVKLAVRSFIHCESGGYGYRRWPGRRGKICACAAAILILPRHRKLATEGSPGGFWSFLPMSQIMPSEPDLRFGRAEEIAALEADARLREDIRLLGRVLGDTVRDQEGAEVFEIVERIRQSSVRFHRDEDRLARRDLENILDSLSTAETVRIVRAFSYFSHLANIDRKSTRLNSSHGYISY